MAGKLTRLDQILELLCRPETFEKDYSAIPPSHQKKQRIGLAYLGSLVVDLAGFGDEIVVPSKRNDLPQIAKQKSTPKAWTLPG